MVATGTRRSPSPTGAGCVVIARRTGRILFCLRAAAVPAGGTWGTWGGKAEIGETSRQTAARELLEETGVAEAEGLSHLHRMNAGSFVFDTYMTVVEDEFVPKIGAETDGYAWLPIDRPPRPLHRGLERMLRDPAAFHRLADEIERVSGRRLAPQTGARAPEHETPAHAPRM